MERPVGVTLLGALSIALGILFALFGVAALLWGLLIHREDVNSWGLNKFFLLGGVIIALLCFAVALLYAAIGRGLLKLQNWARAVLIVFAALGLLGSPASLISSPSPFHSVLALRFPVFVALNIWILFYLFRPHVKQVFGAPKF